MAQVSLTGILSAPPVEAFGRTGSTPSATLHLNVTGVVLREFPASTADPAEITIHLIEVTGYRAAEPDPLHPGAAVHLQHLSAHHPEAVEVLSRLCGREALSGAVRVLPVALDRYGLVLRVERIRDHTDVRLSFGHRIGTGAEAAEEIRHLLAAGARRRRCGRRDA